MCTRAVRSAGAPAKCTEAGARALALGLRSVARRGTTTDDKEDAEPVSTMPSVLPYTARPLQPTPLRCQSPVPARPSMSRPTAHA